MKKIYAIYLILNLFLIAESKGQSITADDILIAQDSIHSVTFDEQTVWKGRRILMEKLSLYPDLVSGDTITAFYNAHLNDNIGLLSKIRLAIDTLSHVESSTRDAIQSYLDLIDGYVANIAQGDSTLANDTTLINDEIVEWQTLNAMNNGYLSTARAYIDTIYNSIESTIIARANAIKSVNDELSTDKVYEQNEIDVNSIYLGTIVKGQPDSIVNYTTQLYNIAKQCPMAGGPSVYYARSLYDLINDSIIYDDDQICGSASDTCLVPPAPGIISGRALGVCGHQFYYNIDTMPNVTVYTWSIDGYAVIDSGQGNTGIWVSFADTFSTGEVSVYAMDSCGSGALRSFAIAGFPNAPASINGPNGVCAYATGLSFSIDSVEGASSYTWRVPSGCTIDSGQGTTGIYVTWNNLPGNVTAIASNGCGGDSAMLTVDIAECRMAAKNIAVVASPSSGDVKLYPNPTTGDVTVIYHLNSNIGLLQLFDVIGKMVGEFKLDGKKNKFDFDASYLCCGIFAYRVMDSANLKGQGKLVIIR